MQDATTRTVRISGERLAELWRQSLMSKETFAHTIGLKRSGTFRLLRPGAHCMFTDNFRKIAVALNITPAELKRKIGVGASGEDESGDAIGGICRDALGVVDIPSFDSVSAGMRCERVGIATGTVKVPPGIGDFCVRIDGESMMPEYPNRAMAIFQSVEGQQFVYGQDYIIWFTNEECYFSRVYQSDEGQDVLVLRKINPDRQRFPNRIAHRRDIARIAHCTAVVVCKT